MIQFSKLRLTGFKSFVDRTEVDIGLGLTGIVGPNGCGKSNTVEALRWVMGENSTKRMRGSSRSMEDVIFAGTAMRPARNMAEVSLLLDNTSHTAPAPYTAMNEIEVTRKIERDHGSTYRINGKVVRARDVQLLFADIVSGANSPFLVSQGKITNIINSKPHDRRVILEEAAGISGLHARRHEAELRLRATDNNLKRLEDLVGSMEGRYQALKRQARQAHRYRNLSAEIRQLETEIMCLEYLASFNELQDVQTVFDEAEAKVAERLVVVTQLTKTQNVQSKDLPDLRQKEAEIMAALQTQKIALQRLEDEGERLTSQIDEITEQLSRLTIDREDVKTRLEDDTQSLERMNAEESDILEIQKKEDKELTEKEQLKDELKAKLDALEDKYNQLMDEYVSKKAHKQSLETQISHDEKRLESLKNRIEQLSETLKAKQDDAGPLIDLDAIRKSIADDEQKQQQLKDAIEKTVSTIESLQNDIKQARESAQEFKKKEYEIQSEINSLYSILNLYSEDQFKPILEDVKTREGFETALSRALGDSLMGSLDEKAPVSWHKAFVSDDLPELPAGCSPLSDYVDAPEQLSASLSQIGVVSDDEIGNEIARSLKAGQSVVSQNGTYWRWDGLQISSEASDRHSVQLVQKNKHAELCKALPNASKDVEKALASLEKLEEKLENANDQRRQTQDELEEIGNVIKTQRHELDDAIQSQSQTQTELAKLEEALNLARTDIAGLEVSLAEQTLALTEFNDGSLDKDEQAREAMREELHELRDEYQHALKNFEISQQEQSRRKARVQAIGDERVNLQNRVIRGNERLKELDNREIDLKERKETLQKRPKEIKIETAKLLSVITERETGKSEISDKLSHIESELSETTKALKEAEQELADAKETRAHAQATIEERQKRIEALKQRIREQFDMAPKELFIEASIDQDNLPDLSMLKEKRERAVRGRDAIGPVNLRAEQEAEELEKELGAVLTERNDLTEAIEELRGAIDKLNKEAKERLQSAFDHVNGHFRTIFTRLFNGGKAHLSLIEDEDPMNSGLEIFAQPPGKALQSLSLLSGGEQTMTAIALIFAMFMTNPAPICVLDEVDAPLDDANVDRFCDLLEEFAERGETRFLVITHHRLTMARMDRLYGVTMTEKGVSKLVSVDLNQQLDFLDAAE